MQAHAPSEEVRGPEANAALTIPILTDSHGHGIQQRCHCVHFQISNSAHVILKTDDTLNILDAGTKLQDFATFICHRAVIHDEVPP
jgi:hypothetical protein